MESGKPDVILEAINQVLDALVFVSQQEIEPEVSPWFYYPVIVLDGRLFSARVESNESIAVTESSYLQLRVVRGLKKAERIRVEDSRIISTNTKSYIIDIVRRDSLEEFLRNFP